MFPPKSAKNARFDKIWYDYYIVIANFDLVDSFFYLQILLTPFY